MVDRFLTGRRRKTGEALQIETSNNCNQSSRKSRKKHKEGQCGQRVTVNVTGETVEAAHIIR